MFDSINEKATMALLIAVIIFLFVLYIYLKVRDLIHKINNIENKISSIESDIDIIVESDKKNNDRISILENGISDYDKISEEY